MADICAILLFTIVLIKHWGLIKKLRIHKKATLLEKAVIASLVLECVILACQPKADFLQLMIGLLGVAAFLAFIYRQGITDSGIITILKGHDIYLWEKIGYVQIEKREKIVVWYFNRSGYCFIKHHFSLQDEELLLSLLQANVKIEYIK